MPALATDYFQKVGSPGNATTLAAPGHTIGGTAWTVVSTSLWPTDTGVTFAVDTTQLVNGVVTRVAGSYTVWSGVVASATTITGSVLRYGTDQNYSAGSTTRVYILPTSTRENRIVDGLLAAGLTQAGGMGAISPTSVTTPTATITNAAITNLTVGSQAPSVDYTVLGTAPNTVTANGQRSYNLAFNSVDYTNILNPGTRLRTTRTVAAPTQCTSLNGTTQYYSRASGSVAGMTFTNNFVVSAWVKLSSYATGTIASRYNGTSGWALYVNSSGQLQLSGYNTGSANESKVTSYQSLPLNKWVHIATQLDMATFTASTTTSYIMLDGIDIPAQVLRSGTSPTALIQAGNLEIGSNNGGLNPFSGKIAQVAIYSAKVTQATILASMNQGLAGTETSLISAYSFNNSINDLNANANNLTANGSAVATNADSPFGIQASGLISSTLDYGIVQSATFSTNTTVVVQVPEGCTIPTSGGVSAVSYSGQKAPYGFPADENRHTITIRWMGNSTTMITPSIAGSWGAFASSSVIVPAGKYFQYSKTILTGSCTTPATYTLQTQFDTTTPTTNDAEGQDRYRADANTSFMQRSHRHIQVINNTTATTYQMYGVITGGAGTQTAYFENTVVSYISFRNAYL